MGFRACQEKVKHQNTEVQMADSLGQFPSKFMFISWLNPNLNRNQNSEHGEKFVTSRSKTSVFLPETTELQMLSTSHNSRSANLFAGCPEKGHVTELLVTERLLYWKIHSQMCSACWSLMQYALLSDQAERKKRSQGDILLYESKLVSQILHELCLCSFLLKPVEHVRCYRMLPQAVNKIIKYLYLSLVDLQEWHSSISIQFTNQNQCRH